MLSSQLLFLSGKRILLISPHYFQYPEAIMKEIALAGGKVEYIDERPGNDFFSKGLIRLNADILRQRILKYYQKELDIYKNNKYDYILVISPEALDLEIIRLVKRQFPSAKYILYMWDSISNKTGAHNAELLPFFDKALSFDMQDCKKYDRLRFRPLFYLDNSSLAGLSECNLKYDLTFIGSIHSDRYKICKELQKQCCAEGLSSYFYLYLSDKKLYWYNRITNNSLRGSKVSDFSYVPLDSKEVKETIMLSKVILDIQHPMQTGLTMRTLEVLGAKKKLITTNYGIKEYDFYHEANVYCLNRKQPTLPLDWMAKPYVELSNGIYEKYSISHWLLDVLGN